MLLPMIDEGRALGLDLTFDTYPYLAGSTILGMIALPPWVQEGGIQATVDRLQDTAVRARLRSEWFEGEIPYALENVTIGMVANAEWRWAEGHTVASAAEGAGLAAGDFVCEILAASGMAVGIIAFRPGERTEADVRAILRHPAHMAGSDGIFCGGFPHPRDGAPLRAILVTTPAYSATTPGRRRSRISRLMRPGGFDSPTEA